MNGRILRVGMAWAAPFAFASAQSVVNAPVAPDTIYVGRLGQVPGISVIDLNGFGQGTGNPRYDPTLQTFTEGWSNFPYNPNVLFQGSLLLPPLEPGSDTITGGSSGVFSLTRDSALDELLVAAPEVQWVGDMMLGQPLDLLLNNGLGSSGCLEGGNLCASDGLQVLVEPLAGGPVVSGGNPISWAPHPNPPARISPPLCTLPLIPGSEPTSVESALPPPLGLGLSNLLVPGDPFGDPASGIPPSGLLAVSQNAFFEGPGLPKTSLSQCPTYGIRQQIGHFLYVADTVSSEVAVYNSNTFEVLARIELEDPVDFAMGPNLDLLAVTQRSLDQVSFVDIRPSSATFHEVVKVVAVGRQPTGIAWDPGNEDILVCNEGDSTVSILAVASLEVRKVLRRGLQRPFDVAICQRQTDHGLLHNVYYAYILNRSGEVSFFESGPAGVGGIGFDTIVGQIPFPFSSPTAIQPDPNSTKAGVWIAHLGQLDDDGQPTGLVGGALSQLEIESANLGLQPLQPGELPSFRDLGFAVTASIGSDQLTGTPVDLAFDNQRNLGLLPGVGSPFSAGIPAQLNSKSQVRKVGSQVLPTNQARFLFAVVRQPGGNAIDVFDSQGQRVDTNRFQPGVQSIPASGAAVLMDYFRQ